MSDEYERSLHDRVTRGGTLTAEEMSSLEAWYRRQDEAEDHILNSLEQRHINLDRLHSEIDAALSRINRVTEQIQMTADENARIGQEIDLLTVSLVSALG